MISRPPGTAGAAADIDDFAVLDGGVDARVTFNTGDRVDDDRAGEVALGVLAAIFSPP
jgi:hypothetical protein